MTHDAATFIDGAMMMGFAVGGLFFLRFWRRTRDRLFLYFSCSFFIMAINRISLTLVATPFATDEESHAFPYLIRLIAFVLILLAIVDKNRKGGRAGGPS